MVNRVLTSAFLLCASQLSRAGTRAGFYATYMPAIDRSLDVVAFISEHFRDIVRRRLSELAGLALIILALLGAIALATWSVQDPSLSHATQTPVRNLLGFPGAIFSDLAMQLLGLASVLLLLPEALLGWRLLAHRPLGDKWKSLIWILATLLAAAFVSTLPRIGSWPLPTGLGGVIGDAVLRVPALVTRAPLSGVSLIVTAALLAVATFASIAVAAGLAWPGAADANDGEDDEIEEGDDEEDADRASAWRGFIVHALLSFKARLMLMFRRKPRQPRPAARTALPGGRFEPRFDGAPRVQAPSLDYDGEDAEAEIDEQETPQAAPRRRPAPRARRAAAATSCPRSIC